jgi:hypothetical protein
MNTMHESYRRRRRWLLAGCGGHCYAAPIVRNGTVWIDHSLAFLSRERLFIPPERWAKERNSYYQRLSLPKWVDSYLEPLIERAQPGVEAVAKAVEGGELRVDDELNLTPLAAEE